MASFEEDLQYAEKINKIYRELAIGSFDSYEHIRNTKLSTSGSLIYFYFNENPDDETFAYKEKGKANSNSFYTNVLSERDLIFDYRSPSFKMQPTPTAKKYELEGDFVMSEEWHFQQSLVLEPSVLRAYVVFYTLKCNHDISKITMQLHIQYIDRIIETMEKHNGNI